MMLMLPGLGPLDDLDHVEVYFSSIGQVRMSETLSQQLCG